MVELLAIVKSTEFVPALLLSLLGGTGSYLHGCKTAAIQRTLFNLMTELVLAVTFGLAIMYFGQWRELPPPLVSVFILIATNNSSDMKPIFKNALHAVFDKFTKTKTEA
ncbi:hypothetical protein [Aliivibrio salmonicida]|uniref:hypothetical protein n=1 Tax=Aliivibrio salmonicida TaxID=40269 RepID=UPI003D140FFF